MDFTEKAKRLMERGVDPHDVGNPQVRRIMQNYQRENYKQQVAQATALNPSGLPQNLPIQPAPMQGYSPIGRIEPLPRTYTWGDGDTVQSVASQFNTTPQGLLAANPDMKQPKTGMVINASPPIPNGYQNNPWGNYTPNWIERTLGSNTTPLGNATPLHNKDWMQKLYTCAGLYPDLSGRQWWERKKP